MQTINPLGSPFHTVSYLQQQSSIKDYCRSIHELDNNVCITFNNKNQKIIFANKYLNKLPNFLNYFRDINSESLVITISNSDYSHLTTY